MTISASQVKELRERTGAGMMECKRALEAADGDLDAAAEAMRREGLAKADKKAGRVAAEGRVVIAVGDDKRSALLLEINCETDFVAKNEAFVSFAESVAETALHESPANLDELNGLTVDGETVEHRRRELVAQIGENVNVRRFRRIHTGQGVLSAYLHGSRIGSVVALTESGNETLARDLAMHVAASAPRYLSADDVPEKEQANEREILLAQARDSGKPEHIVEKMVEGRLRKHFAEITLLGQPFVKDPDKSVGELLREAGAAVTDFARFEVGEGIEKKEEDFAAEVMAQARQGSS